MERQCASVRQTYKYQLLPTLDTQSCHMVVEWSPHCFVHVAGPEYPSIYNGPLRRPMKRVAMQCST